jgi:hypothetical protein
MTKTLKYYGNNVFFYATIGSTRTMVGCATGYKRSVKNSAQDVSCPGNGSAKSYVSGKLPDYDFSFDGIVYEYTSPDVATNVGIKDFWANAANGTQVEIVLGKDLTASTIIEKTTFIVESCDETAKFGEMSTYSVSGKASGGWTFETISA